MNPISIYGFSQSTYVQTVMMVCFEKKTPYELKGIDFGSSVHAAKHPFLKVPVAEIDGYRLYETLAIVTMIDELGESNPLQPDSLRQKSLMLQWICASIDYLYPALISVHFNEQHTAADKANAVAKVVVLIDQQLQEHPYMAGDAASLADFFVYPMLNFTASQMSDFSLMLKEQKHLNTWLQLMRERPSAKATVMTEESK